MIKINKLIILFFLSINFIVKSQNIKKLETTIDSLKTKVIDLEKENILLIRKNNEYHVTNNLIFSLIDKIDSLYSNSFNRFMILISIIGSITIFVIPYYLKQIQNKILETKKKEITNFSKEEINKLELQLTTEINSKYIELNDFIGKINAENNELLKKEIIKTEISNLYIASKINELDKKHNAMLRNLTNAVIKSNSITAYDKVNFYLDIIWKNLNSLQDSDLKIENNEINVISNKLISLRDINEINQDLLENVIIQLIRFLKP